MPAGRRSRRLTAASSMRARCRAAIAMSCAKWRCAEGASWTRSTRPVSRDARHATCGVSMRRSMRTCSSDRLRHPPTRVHRVVRVRHACAMCRCACRSRSERALARVRRTKFRARCRIHASFFLRTRSLASASMHALVPMPNIASRARAWFIASCMRVAVNRHGRWVCGRRVFAGSNALTRSSGARKCAFAWSSDAHARSRLR